MKFWLKILVCLPNYIIKISVDLQLERIGKIHGILSTAYGFSFHSGNDIFKRVFNLSFSKIRNVDQNLARKFSSRKLIKI
jgi:hypothetical protein